MWDALEMMKRNLFSKAWEVSGTLGGRPACMFKPPSSFSLRVPLKLPLGPGHVLPTARMHSLIPETTQIWKQAQPEKIE